jgi:flagellar motor switch protein FliM
MVTKKKENLKEEMLDEGEELDASEELDGEMDELDEEPSKAEEYKEEALPTNEIDEVGEESAKMTADVPVQVVAVLGKKTISVKELVSLKLGQVIDLARPVSETVDLIAGGKLFAKGELVDIDGKLGVRVIKIVR